MAKWIAWALVLAGVVALGQGALEDFPLGVTAMTWRVKSSGLAAPQELSLRIEGKAGGQYRIELGVTAEGTAAELGTLGFLGSALFVQASGVQVDLSSLLVLARRRETLKVGESYVLPGGTFLAREKAPLAGVQCLLGEFRPADRAGTVIEIGFALSNPVYFLPLMRVREGDRITFEMVLIAYQRP
ncbi:MAG: hypothetical protein N2320_05970 [Candidatus Bipolaricaulota bacterium]|nr:hypothetical protein [Candidatus Bipolaricaulota bacterium]